MQDNDDDGAFDENVSTHVVDNRTLTEHTEPEADVMKGLEADDLLVIPEPENISLPPKAEKVGSLSLSCADDERSLAAALIDQALAAMVNVAFTFFIFFL